MSQYSEAVLNALAPKIPTITVCNAPEIEQRPSLFARPIVVSMLYVTYKPEFLRLALPLIRRTEQAAYEYEQGRASLIRFLEMRTKQQDRLGIYARALSHFEQCIMQAYIALTLFEKMTGQRPFTTGDQSEAERLNRHYSNIKHFAGDVASPKGALRNAHTITSPVWIVDAGVESHEGILTWAALKETLDDLLRCAALLATGPASKAGEG